MVTKTCFCSEFLDIPEEKLVIPKRYALQANAIMFIKINFAVNSMLHIFTRLVVLVILFTISKFYGPAAMPDLHHTIVWNFPGLVTFFTSASLFQKAPKPSILQTRF